MFNALAAVPDKLSESAWCVNAQHSTKMVSICSKLPYARILAYVCDFVQFMTSPHHIHMYNEIYLWWLKFSVFIFAVAPPYLEDERTCHMCEANYILINLYANLTRVDVAWLNGSELIAYCVCVSRVNEKGTFVCGQVVCCPASDIYEDL